MIDSPVPNQPGTRRTFLQKAAATGVIAAGAANLGQARAAGGNVLPNLYRNWNAMEFRAIRQDEDVHVEFLTGALGNLARPKPTFKNLLQPDLVSFAQVAKALENTGTGAYLGALPALLDRGYVAAAGSIALIEARHAGYLDVLFNLDSTVNVFGQPQEFERALTVDEVVNLAGGFIQSLNDPNGMYPLTFSSTPSEQNDLAILNFALALEYLEAEFYDLNVPRFFP